jgi:sterol desaturase/sphingolipid hydroxylase (fatty acid hydroxylase superfamily)
VTTFLALLGGFVVGAFIWNLAEYLLHRFAMHHLHGRGIMSREHLEHHVKAGWNFSPILLLSWLGVVVVGIAGLLPLAWLLAGPVVAGGVALGWGAAYFFYEYQHAASHLRAPRGRYSTWVRHHHFHHHFGHPMANHGVTTPLWDHVFGTWQAPGVIKVPRRMALPWLVDERGEVRPEYRDRYALVGPVSPDARLDALDRARAFASEAPVAALDADHQAVAPTSV